MASVAANIEHCGGTQPLHGAIDKVLLLLPLVATVVIGCDLVVGPAGVARLGRQLTQRACKRSQVAAEDLGCDFRRLLQPARATGWVLAAFKQVRNRDERP